MTELIRNAKKKANRMTDLILQIVTWFSTIQE